MKITITLIKTKTLTDKIISLGMFLWAVLRGLPVKTTYGHMEIGYAGETIGATSKGIVRRRRSEYLEKHASKYKEYDFELSESEALIFYRYIDETRLLKYEFENFWWHFIKIIFGKWYGNKTTKETYCYEFGLELLKRLGYDVDVYMNPYESIEWFDSKCSLNIV